MPDGHLIIMKCHRYDRTNLMGKKRDLQEGYFPILNERNILFYEASLLLFCGRMKDFVDKI